MSAVKIIFKRSSLLGKRPTGANLEPGEIGLNTNSNDPGLFFEVNNGSVVKVGPTAYLPEKPTVTPSLGELWVDRDTKTLSIGTEKNTWQKVAAPFLGGTSGLTVFVAPEYENATDSLLNDGQAVPFISINRAILEVTKQIILDEKSGISTGNNRYLIVLAPGRHCVINGPGQSTLNFNVNFSVNQYQKVTQSDLQQFNSELGGVILPRGVSIIGLDLKKCEIHPVYVPKYTHPSFPPDYVQDVNDGPVYQNEPISHIFRWSGNTYVSQFNARDKIESRIVVGLSEAENGNAVFRTKLPHGLNYNDFVQVSYVNSVDQADSAFSSGAYYANPINLYEFELSAGNWNSDTARNPVKVTLLPRNYLSQLTPDTAKFNVYNIYPYFIPVDGSPYEYSNYSHHRLSVFGNASVPELNNFYTKVQKAFSSTFGNTINTTLVSSPEHVIVAPTNNPFPNNLDTNSTDNSSPYQNSVNHRSNYGMANGNFDGDLVTGFKSVILNASTAVVLQKDPAAYEVYTDTLQTWNTLTKSVQNQLPPDTPITSVPTSLQLQELNETSIPNIRYYYKPIYLADGKSTGVPDPNTDFRHFGFKISGAGSFLQAQSTYTIGAAIAVWATYGAIVSLTNATTNFGSVAFQSEGFAGMGTLGGANTINKGFLHAGVSRPLSLTEFQVTSDAQKKILNLGSKVVHIGLDPDNVGVQLLYLQSPFDPATILPYSLKPGTPVFVYDGSCTYSAYFVTNGQPTCILSETDPNKNPYSPGGGILRLRFSDSTIPNGPADITCLEIPYIRRYIDPRSPSQRAYGFLIQSTSPVSQAPQLGSVLRLNQTGQNLSTSLKRNFQFDPGKFGGIAQVFSVDLVETAYFNQSVNFNNKVSDSNQSTTYAIYTSLTDASYPWIQSVETAPNVYTPFYSPAGTYTTFDSRNYYAAENNLYSSLFYDTTFNKLNGPTKVSPNKFDSPFVTTSVLERQEPITESWQGLVPDPYYSYYVSEILPEMPDLTYMRGAVVPYQSIFGSDFIDSDDGSNSLGIIFTRQVTEKRTITTGPSTVAQTGENMTSPFVANPKIGRPELISLPLLQVSPLTHPKNGVSVVKLSHPNIKASEYVRIISFKSNTVVGIRNYYPEYAEYSDGATLPAVWPSGTEVLACVETCYPEPSVYDPNWAVTKATVVRFYELMGYPSNKILPYLTPRYSGERVLLNTELSLSPINGYANTTTSWPIEFNNPSTIFANTHTWQYAGYYDYSRGLPKNQVNEISRKLQYDYLCTTVWGGRLNVFGTDQSGSVILGGALREALTGNFFINSTPIFNPLDNVLTPAPEPFFYPNPVLVYSADDFSDQFDGARTTFDLKRGGVPIPISQLSETGMFVALGGVMQIPGAAYQLRQSDGVPLPIIQFTEPPLHGTSCDVRVVTSDDGNRTMEVVSYTTNQAFNSVNSTFVLTPSKSGLNADNSFIFLSGVSQTPQGFGHPDPAYTINSTPSQTSISFIGDPPMANLSYDFRGIVPGPFYRAGNYQTVNVITADDISVFFDSARTAFPLYVDNLPLDPSLVNAENMFVTLGAVVQIPHIVEGNLMAGNAYIVRVNTITNLLEIVFAAAPEAGTSCTIRIVASEPKDQIVCQIADALQPKPIYAGDGVEVNEFNEIDRIDPGLIG